MKKILQDKINGKKIVCLLFILISAFAHAQVAINTDGSLPHSSSMLDIKNPNRGLLIPRTSTTTRNSIPGVKGLLVYDTTANSFWYHNGSVWNQISTGSSTNYWTQDGSDIYNNNTANVGIGNSNPLSKLHVTGDILQEGSLPRLTLRGGTNQGILMQPNSSTTNAAITYFDGRLSMAAVPTVFGLAPYHLVINSNSNIGIGTGDPETRLHVTGGSDVGNAGGGFLQLGASNSTNIGFDNNEIQGRNNGAVSRLVLQNGGGGLQVGPNPVPSGYAMSVTGKVVCEELKVQLASNWPDYVFSPDYKRMTIAELERFIHSNKHLPGIPAAVIIEKNGLEVGDMQRLMMEKIEELTLYIIELKKEIDALKK